MPHKISTPENKETGFCLLFVHSVSITKHHINNRGHNVSSQTGLGEKRYS